jgi:DNA-binding MarR family transcriptional regulator
MNVLLQALERDGYVTRPAAAPVGKVLPTRLTPRGRRSLEKATAAVRSIEVRMLAGLTEAEQSGAFRILQSMVRSLRGGIVAEGQPGGVQRRAQPAEGEGPDAV